MHTVGFYSMSKNVLSGSLKEVYVYSCLLKCLSSDKCDVVPLRHYVVPNPHLAKEMHPQVPDFVCLDIVQAWFVRVIHGRAEGTNSVGCWKEPASRSDWPLSSVCLCALLHMLTSRLSSH
jgi:hypothetical protein